MAILRVIGAGLVILVSLAIFTIAYAMITLYIHNLRAPHPAKAIGLGVVLFSPLYWALALALTGAIVWLFARHRHVAH
jgi:hypothetical protein